MRTEEARELFEIIRSCSLPKGATILNVGSSTGYFRQVVQPHIHQCLFEPLQQSGYKVVHCDIKNGDDIDFVGDVLDRKFQKKLEKENPALVLCSNLLEHLIDRSTFISALARIVPPERYLLVSVPSSYPYHGDPIDTLFRPSPDDLAADFPGWLVISKKSVLSGNFWSDLKATQRPGRELIRYLLSVAFAIRSPSMLYRRIDRLRWLWRRYSVSIVLLQNQCR